MSHADDSGQGLLARLLPDWLFGLGRRGQYLADLVVLIGSFALAYGLRFDFQIPQEEARRALVQLPVVVLLQFVVIVVSGIYSFVWRYIGLAEIKTFVRAGVISALVPLTLRLALPDQFQDWRVPLSVIVMDTVFAFGGILALRVVRRIHYETGERRRRAVESGATATRPVLLVGAGRAGMLAVREIQGRGDMKLQLAGFVDDDPLKAGAVIQGVKVLGATRDLPRLVKEHNIDHVIITIAEGEPAITRRVVETCQRIGIKVRTIPGLYEILQGRVSMSRFRDIELENLLGRDPVRLDQGRLDAFLRGQTVMVTGAGGSIGAELVRKIARFHPQELVLIERAEGALFEIDREVGEAWPEVASVSRLADVNDMTRMTDIMKLHRPHVVVHAAAHKHVPMMEANPSEAIQNNVLATQRLGSLAAHLGVETFVLISTDKAVRPTSIMGASKRMAEIVIQDLNNLHPDSRFLAVRFGNVIGSAGSVIPIFQQQIERGGPVTVTDPEISRYFMTIPEACELVLEAAAIGGGGEIMILDMGEPVKILDLARQMIRLSGYEPETDIPIAFTGLRPGEKLHEELASEAVTKTGHPKIFVGKLDHYPPAMIVNVTRKLEHYVATGDDRAIRSLLAETLPEASLDAEPESALLERAEEMSGP